MNRSFRALCRNAFALAMSAAAPVWGADAAADCLYRSFDIPAGDAWGPHAIELSPGDWRIGDYRGPPVDEAGLKRQLAEIGRLVIGGVCTGTREGDTYRACGFALAEPVLAGRRYDNGPSLWHSTTGTSVFSPIGPGDAGIVSAFSALDAVPVEGVPEDFVGLRAPPTLLQALRGAYGATLSFSFRAVTNPQAEPMSSTGGGFVVICPDGEGSSTPWRTESGQSTFAIGDMKSPLISLMRLRN